VIRPSWNVIDARDEDVIDWVGRAAGTIVYVPAPQRLPNLAPDLVQAARIFAAIAGAGAAHLILVSSTAVYGATPHHAGLALEHRMPGPGDQPVARCWQTLESSARASAARVTILRAAPVVAAAGRDFFSRLLTSSPAFTVAGHDPTMQFLAPSDLARAIDAAVEQRASGTFNIVPSAPIPLKAALELAGRQSVPLPWAVHRTRRVAGVTAAQLQFIRYHLTADGAAAARDLGFTAQHSSADAIRLALHLDRLVAPAAARFDPFGLDHAYIERSWRGFMGFLHRRYWRVETAGLDRIPRQGGAVLVGMHRGFMPFDGVMTLHSVVQGTGRVPRFLIHPGVGMRFPFLFDLMSKLGGVIACHENANRILESGELLGVYPEGIRGAFTMYKRAHLIGPSWRNDCVAFALRHRVPIVPFVTIGSAEIFPIVGRIDWGWWKKFTEWPFIPITTPVPLPSKWHTQFLEPLHVEREYGREAAEDPAVVRAVGCQVRRHMEAAMADLVGRRRSVFRGSIIATRP
jgi:1-acyl-sn-glycerol-3-phosphate acyltransferase/nucleoside-diphosphate-sugar epimerase